MMGTMVRVMRFQSSVSLIGTTGWMFRIQTLRFSGPVLKLKLFWNGTLMRSATGFCVFLARSVALSLSPVDGAAGCSARSGLASSTATINRANHAPARVTNRRLGTSSPPTVFGGVSEHPPRDVEAHPRDDVRERQALVTQATLERPGAQPHQLGDGMQIGVAVGEQRGDDLVHGAGDVVVRARFLETSIAGVLDSRPTES
jgi:hypothetical protein